ncbi:hypothetical protein GGR50DRAFT_274705 [Xylaria sp. CBS 124048]|nr:hypothetical protein GGR50DRAFT_274705 [Xylaria sp. CBS 124048]
MAPTVHDKFDVTSELSFLSTRPLNLSTIILAAFNIVFAAATAAGIFHRNYLITKRSRLRFKEWYMRKYEILMLNANPRFRITIFTCVRGSDVYPFILSLAILFQGVIFAVSQALSLDTISQSQCTLISQFMLPVIFIVPYTQLVFTVEITLRALKAAPFQARSKYAVAICMTIVIIALVATGLVTYFVHVPDVCFASLFWFVARWAVGGLALTVGIIVIMVGCVVMIYLKLKRHWMIEHEERVNAFRMICYILFALISNILMVPFFGYLTIGDLYKNGGSISFILSTISTVAANVTGLMTGGLYLLLQYGTLRCVTRNGKPGDYEGRIPKYQSRTLNANDADFGSQIAKPIAVPPWPLEAKAPENMEDRELERDNTNSTSPSESNSMLTPVSLPENRDIRRAPSTTPTPKASSLYVLFPNTTQVNKTSRTSSSPLTNRGMPLPNDIVQLPAPIRPPSHRRWDPSIASSTTLPTSLRVYSVPGMRQTALDTVKKVESMPEIGHPGRPRALATNSVVSTLCRSQLEQVDFTMKALPPLPLDLRTKICKKTSSATAAYSVNNSAGGDILNAQREGFNASDISTSGSQRIKKASPLHPQSLY